MSDLPPSSNAPPPKTRRSRAAHHVRSWLNRPLVRRVVALGSVITVITGLVGTIANLERVPQYACRVPGVHALCGWAQVGHVAGEAEEKAWSAAKEARSPAALRAYVVAFPTGVFVTEASSRLAACRSVQREVWKMEQRALPLYVAAASSTAGSLTAARDDALRRGNSDAALACAGFSGEFRLRGAAAVVREWVCRERPEGTTCGFDGLAQCSVEARQLFSEEVCR